MKRLLGRLGSGRADSSQAPEENWTVVGVGNARGREWSDHANLDGPDRAMDLAWLAGFFSGLSLGENYTFLAADSDLAHAINWMDQRLASNPDEKVSQAAAQMGAQLLDPRRSNPW